MITLILFFFGQVITSILLGKKLHQFYFTKSKINITSVEVQ